MLIRAGSKGEQEDFALEAAKVRELQGVMTSLRADQSLLVAWGGLTKPAAREAATLAFRMRVWDSNDLLDAIFECYERLPEDLRAQLPLVRVWTTVAGLTAQR